MAFRDYSPVPASNTALGDGTYIGPNMLRNKVRPALQQLAADGRALSDEVREKIKIAKGDKGEPGGTVTLVGLLYRSDGLLYRSDGSLGTWTGGTARWSVASRPALVGFDRSAIPALVPGPGSDAGGIRESCIFDDDDGARYLFYGAGDGTQGPGGPWRVQLAKTLDGGLNWQRLGPLNPGLGHGYDAGVYPATDMLHVEKRDGEYLLHRMSAGAVTSNQVPSQPYYSDLWKAAVITGPYTFVRKILEAGAAGSFDATDSIASSVVFDGIATYHLFYSATNQGQYQIGRATSASPQGPFVKTGVPVLPANLLTGSPENPKVSWHPGLARWVMLTNQITGGFTAYNRLFFSKSLTDWSRATYCDFGPLSPMAGAEAMGLASGFYGPTNVPLLDQTSNPLGAYPITYDTDPTDGNHIGRKLYYMPLEPSTRGMLTAANVFHDDFSTVTLGDLGGQNGWSDDSRGDPKPQVIAGGVLSIGNAPGSGTGASFVVRPSPGTSVAQRTLLKVGGPDVSIAQIFGYKGSPGFGRFIYVAFGTSSVDVGAYDGATTTLIAASPVVDGNPHWCEAVYDPVSGRFQVYVDFVLRFQTAVLSATHQGWMAEDGNLVGLRVGNAGTGARLVYSHTVSSPLLATDAPIYRILDHTTLCLEMAVRRIQENSYLDLFTHLQDAASTNDGYRIRLDLGGANAVCAGIYKRFGGVETALVGVTPTRTQKASPNLYATIRLTAAANVLTVEVNGETQFQTQDSTFASGVAIAQSGSGEIDIRALSARKGNTVTVNGLVAGQVVTLRGPGRYPIATVTATSPVVTLPLKHSPATSIDVGGVPRHTPIGGIWGGDIYA